MESGLRILFTATALADLRARSAWYEERQAAEAGARVLTEILEQVERLQAYPQTGRVVPEFGLEELREVVHPPFRIVYRVEEGRVLVLHVWRGERPLKMS